MSIFNLTEKDALFIGNVQAVDTASIVVKVENAEVLSDIQVNNLVIIQASKTRQTLIGMVNKIIRTYSVDDIVSSQLFSAQRALGSPQVFIRQLATAPLTADIF